MSVSWTIASGSTERSLSAWGIRAPVLTRRSYAADELTFEIVRKDVLGSATFAEGESLTLKRDGTAYFIGTVTKQEASFGRDGERELYTVSNAWYQLERLVYQQLRCLWNAGFTATTTQDSAHVVLGQASAGGRYVTTTAAMSQVISYALLRGVTIVSGSIIGGVDFPLEEARDLTCAEVIRRLGALTPDSVAWIDYAGGLQTFNFGRRDTLTAVSFDVTDTETIESGRVVPRGDLKPTGVRFDFVGSEPNEADGRNFVRIAQQISGLPDRPGGLIATIQLDGAGTNNQAAVPSGLASSYYAALLALQYEGTIVTRGRDVRGDCKVGHAVNLTNGRAAWATMRGVVQSVSEDIASGATTIDFGPPERLPAQDFVDQLLFVRRKRPSTNLQSTMTCRRKGPNINDDGNVPDTGGDEEDNPDAGLDPKETDPVVSLVACEGGEEVTYVVKGQRAYG